MACEQKFFLDEGKFLKASVENLQLNSWNMIETLFFLAQQLFFLSVKENFSSERKIFARGSFFYVFCCDLSQQRTLFLKMMPNKWTKTKIKTIFVLKTYKLVAEIFCYVSENNECDEHSLSVPRATLVFIA